MNHLKKVLFGLALAVALVSFGASNASADCTKNKPVTTATSVHAEGTTELLAVMTIVCDQVIPFTGSATSNMSLVFSPTTTKVTIGAGTTPSVVPAAPGVSNICTGQAPDNRSTFPCPQIQGLNSAGAGTAVFANATVAVTTSGNILNFNFTACAPAGNPAASCAVPPGGASTITFTVTGIRINVASTALPAGGAVTASEVTSGGVGSVSNSSVVFGIVQQTLGLGTGFTNTTTIAYAACGPKVPTPLGSPLTIPPVVTPNSGAGTTGNPDTTAGLSSTLKVAFAEGFLSAFALAGTLDNGFASQGAPTVAQPNPTGAAGGVGLRLRINLTGIPSGFVAYVPEQVSGGGGVGLSNAATGSVVLGAGAGLTVLTLVSAPAADGSGGVLVGAVKDQYDLVTPSGGVAAITYEVTANASPVGLEVVNVNIALTGTATTGVGSISGQLSLGPVGPPTINAALPQFAAINKPGVVATVGLCASYLLFPWVANTNDGNYDTGFAISNTTSDPSVIGTTGQAGDVNLYIFPSDGSAAITQTIATGLKPGATATFVLSSLKKAVLGYAIAVCNFTLGHGFAFIDNPIAGQNGFAEGYLALSITNPRLGAAIGLNESAGH